MQQIIKNFNPLRWIAAMLFAAVLFIGCNSSESKTESAKTEEAAPAASKTDSLPPVDPNATSRPEDGKTK